MGTNFSGTKIWLFEFVLKCVHLMNLRVFFDANRKDPELGSSQQGCTHQPYAIAFLALNMINLFICNVNILSVYLNGVRMNNSVMAQLCGISIYFH